MQIDSELLERTVHESGHYVALGFALRHFGVLAAEDREFVPGDLSINEDEGSPAESGSNHPPHVRRVDPQSGIEEIIEDGVRAEIVALFAGMLAQREYSTNTRARQLLADAWDDLQQVKRWLRHIPVTPGERARLREIAQRAVSENWDAIWRLATALYTYRELEACECRMILNNEIDEFEDYREQKEREKY